MNEEQLELRVGRWLAAGPTSAPDRLAIDAAVFAAAHPRGRGMGWRNLFAGVGALTRPMPFALRPIVLLALIALTFALGAFFYAAWHNNAVIPQPSPTVQPSPTIKPSAGPAGYACPPGTDPGAPGVPSQARPERWPSAQIAIDSESNVVVYAAALKVWAFDLCTNTWRDGGRLASSHCCSGTTVAYDADSDRTVIIQGDIFGDTAVYDANSNTVSHRGDPVMDPRAVYDPGTGLVIVRDRSSSRLWTYRLETDEWRELQQQGDVPPVRDNDAQVLTYDLSVGRLILYARYDDDTTQPGQATYEFDLQSSTWYQQEIDTPALDYSWWHEARFSGTYDVLSQRTLIYNNGRLIAYDAMRHEWSVVFDQPDIRSTEMGVALAYDPLGERVIALGANPLGLVRPLPGSDSTLSNDVAALDFGSVTWTELLAGAVSPVFDFPPASSEPTH